MQIAFVKDVNESPSEAQFRIGGIDLDGSDIRYISRAEDCADEPEWSPDGSKIVASAFLECNPHSNGIVVIPAEGGAAVEIAHPESFNEAPGWSADGQEVVFSSFQRHADGTSVWAVRSDGTGLRQVTPEDAFEHWGPSAYGPAAFAS
jgi:Tol biopolymer transport system component